MANKVKIGILNLMHDKLDTQSHFIKVLPNADLTFFYPRMHYQNRPIPAEVNMTSKPLDINRVSEFDGFIITGAPIDQIDFSKITYIVEIRCLLQALDNHKIQQLYFCWGAMAALNHFYGIKKKILTKKIFGVFPYLITEPHPLLSGLSQGFMVPHARYAEMDKKQIMQDERLAINAVDDNGHLFMVSSKDDPERNFIFSHIEYGKDSLRDEYNREITTHHERHYKKPINYSMSNPSFQWQDTQKIFFNNLLKKVKDNKLVLN